MDNQKFRMYETLIDSLKYCKENWKNYGLNSLIVIIGYIVMVLVMVALMRGSHVNISVQSPENNIWLQVKILFLFLPMIIIFLVMMCVYIKKTDDIYEMRSTDLKEQYRFVFNRIGRILVSGVIVIIPFVLIQVIFIYLVSKTNDMFPLFLFALLFGMGIWLFSMVMPSILIEDVGSIEAIKRSVKIVVPNLLRIFVFYISCFIGYIIIVFIFAFLIMLFMMIPIVNIVTTIGVLVSNYVIGFLLLPFPMVFITLLFKSMTHTPYDKDERLPTVALDNSYDDLFEDRKYD